MSKSQTPAPPSGDLVLHQGLVLVETADAALMVELQADPRIRAGIVALLSPCVAVVRPGFVAQFVENLMKAGHTPKVSDL